MATPSKPSPDLLHAEYERTFDAVCELESRMDNVWAAPDSWLLEWQLLVARLNDLEARM